MTEPQVHDEAGPGAEAGGADGPEPDPVIHAVARLRIVSVLAALPEGDTLSFPRLQGLLGLTAGNLITHLRRLEDAQYVEVARTGAGRSARTTVRLTAAGRDAFTRYSATLRSILGG